MDTHIINRLDKHILKAHWNLCESVDGGVFERTDDWVRGFTGSAISTFNILLLLRNQALNDDLLSDTDAYFNEQGVPHVVAFDEHWFSGGTEFLHSRNYQPLPPLPGMVLLGPPRRMRPHPDLVVERVGTPAEMSVYCKLISELFGLPITETTHLFSANQVQDDAIRHYVGYVDEVPVVAGTGVLSCSDPRCRPSAEGGNSIDGTSAG
jgi:hypothetical protein